MKAHIGIKHTCKQHMSHGLSYVSNPFRSGSSFFVFVNVKEEGVATNRRLFCVCFGNKYRKYRTTRCRLLERFASAWSELIIDCDVRGRGEWLHRYSWPPQQLAGATYRLFAHTFHAFRLQAHRQTEGWTSQPGYILRFFTAEGRLKMRDMNLRHQFARVEFAGHENAGPTCRVGKCRIWKCGTN